MPPRIPHIIVDGVEKKRCSKCKQYLPLNQYIYKKDRWDKLHNECDKCKTTRNKRRYKPDYVLEVEEEETDGTITKEEKDDNE